MRSRLLVIASFVLASSWPAASWASAGQDLACQVQASSLMDQYLWPAEGGDNDFFTNRSGSTPNLLWILDNSCSMRDTPHSPSWDSHGCSDSTLNNVGYTPYLPTCDASWDCTYPNPAPDYDPTYTDPSGASWGGHTGEFVAGTAYWASNTWAWNPSPDSGKLGPINSVCANFGGYANECKQCIYTHGYYNWYGNVVADGNFVNVYPPKYVVARKVFKDVLLNPKLAMVRMGLMDYSGWIKTGLNPACNLADANATPAKFANDRSSLSKKVESMTRADFHTDTPLANTVRRAEEYYSTPAIGSNPSYFAATFGSGSVMNAFESPSTTNQKSVCWACQFNAIAVITDGMPFGDGSEVPSQIKNVSSSQCPGCNGDLLPKVAWWFYNHDIRSDWNNVPEPQHVSVFTIGFGLSVPVLQEAADVSGGKAYSGDNATQLEKAMGNITKDVAKRAITFTSANLSQVQSSATQSVFVPKLLPKRDGPWYGRLYRFRFISEFALGVDLNGDGQYNALYLVDKNCKLAASFYSPSVPSTCRPIRAATTADAANYPAGTIKVGDFYQTQGFYTSPSDPRYQFPATPVPATPVWEASDLLGSGTSANGVPRTNPDQRRVFTAIDGAGTSAANGVFDSTDVIPFDEAHVDQIRPYLDLTDQSPFCQNWVSSGVSHPLQECAKGIIAYVRGCVYGSTSTDGCTQRPDMLGDIFHSQPVLVAPPTQASMMNTPLRNPADLLTLSESEMPNGAGSTPAYTLFSEGDPNGTPKYMPYKLPDGYGICHRDEFVLVGANDGMLHAFDAGTWQPATTGTGPYSCHAAGSYDEGTGQELWAFIPPDLLPKLQYYGLPGFPHQLYVDGSAWVRDVWVDGLNPNDPAVLGTPDEKQEPDEFRTLAVVGERRGGHHYFALDVTEGGKPGYTPILLWMFPKLGSQYEVQVGESWNDTAQLPPPIGPIRLKHAGGGGVTTGGFTTPWVEKWIVAVGGGFDPYEARGRGFFFLDAWTGQVLWDFTRGAQETTVTDLTGANAVTFNTSTAATQTVRKALKYSFASAPALTGWGDSAMLAPGTDTDYFDTLVDGDTGGQLWVARFRDPDPANWSAGRIFIPGGKSADPNQEPWHQPFFETPSLTWMPESAMLRAYVGTGNRFALRDRSGGTCSLNDPLVCALSGQCDKVDLEANQLQIKDANQVSDVDAMATSVHQDKGVGAATLTASAIDSCPDLTLDVHATTNKCQRYSGPPAQNADYHVNPKCHFDTTQKAYVCDQALAQYLDPNASDPELDCVDTSSIPANRFYAIRLFDGQPFDTPAGADTYDTNRLTEADLVDVTPPSSLTASSVDAGWYYRYVTDAYGTTEMVSERTASAAVFAASSVVWATLAPNPNKPLACGGTSGGGGGVSTPGICAPTTACPCTQNSNQQTAYVYFRNYVTGSPGKLNLGAYATPSEVKMSRKVTGTQPSPPRQPNVISQIGGGANAGKVQTSVADTGGSEASSESNQDIFGQSNVIDVSREVHDWRHAACGLGTGTVNICQ